MCKKILEKAVLFLGVVFFFTACEDNLVPYYPTQERGSMAIIGYAADTINIAVKGQLLVFDDSEIFIEEIEENYEFVSYNNQDEIVDILDYETGAKIYSYMYTNAAPLDTISFFYKQNYFIDNVLSSRKGTLSQPGYTGYKFIFPNMGDYSGSNYTGSIDGIIRNLAGQELGIAENITKGGFSTFVEFPFGLPPIIRMELVKHGTNESYVEGQQIIVEMVLQDNESKMIVLEEREDENNSFEGVSGNIDLTEYFDFQQE